MRLLCTLVICLFISSSFSQNVFRDNYNKLFPNNKQLKIQKLESTRDSLIKVNDILNSALIDAQNHNLLLVAETKKLNEDIAIEKNNSANAHSTLINKVAHLEDSINRILFPIVSCKEEQIVRKGLMEPIIKNTCSWRHYQLIETGTPDYKGRYTWKTELFKKSNDSLIKITNADLFKSDKITELERMINERLSEDFLSLKSGDPECFGRRQKYTNFKLKDMRITFNENSDIVFEVQYALSDACFAVNSASTGFKIMEIKSLLAE